MFSLQMKIILLSIFSLFGFLISCHQEFSEDVRTEIFKMESKRVLPAANIYLKEEPLTITAVFCERSAGSIHDYYSEGDYWWPDPENSDGPYIRRDGMTNPDNFVAHRQLMRRLSIQVAALASAYILTNDSKYSEKVLQHLLAWFVNPETRMNPHLLYAQAIKGIVIGRGIGIIDTIHLVEIARAIQILEKRQAIKLSIMNKIKLWFREYLDWLTTHEYGIAERDNGNNHSTCWNMQVAAFADLLHQEDQKQYCRNFFKEIILPQQMDRDGSFPKELKRTKPYGYSLFNLDAMVMNCQILSIPVDNLWQFYTADGKNIRQAIEFLFPYIKDKSSWPYEPDVMYFDNWPVRQPALLFAGLAYREKKYLNLWKELDPDPTIDEIIRNFPIRQPILWLE